MTPLITQTLALATEQLTAVNTLIGCMRPPLAPPGRPQCALFLTVAEQFEAAVRLAHAGLITHSAVHVRSMLEATADLHLLGQDSQHVERMRYKQARGEKRFYDQMLAYEGLPDGVRTMIDGRMADCLARYEPLHEEFGGTLPTQAASFKAAGMDFVIGLYTMLCGFSHNDLSALALRHQGDSTMMHRAEVPEAVASLILSLASTALMHATYPMNGIAWTPEGEFDRLFGTMNDLHGKMMDLRDASQTADVQ
ncbi:hypothetical protein I5U56_05025 [Stenotrophomonas maltophilia]|nr:DUF5677 domain-containing protein [Stenotrophomonas pavanii]MBH1600051.1 hypothetical protein [Stenotrophomonas maltophilia]